MKNNGVLKALMKYGLYAFIVSFLFLYSNHVSAENDSSHFLSDIYPSNNKPLYNGGIISWKSNVSGIYHLYIGESPEPVLSADVHTKLLIAKTAKSQYDITHLQLKSGLKYYWRIDVKKDGKVIKGAVNAFVLPIKSDSYHNFRNGLRNSLLQFSTKESARVAFLGGSITFNGGWRDSVCAYLKKRFPTTKFEFINAGIPSTGSTPAAFRMERDVLSKGKVDLLFEEAAVNDGTNGNRFPKIEQIRAMEGIVRHARVSNPSMDIVFMYFVDPGKISSYNKNEVPDVIINHDHVAHHYGIPAINLAKEVTDRINTGEFDWKQDFVNLHPSPFGQGVYARSIISFLDKAWEKPITKKERLERRTLPSKIDENCYDMGRLVDINKAELSQGWSIVQNWKPTDKVETRADYTDVPMLIGQVPESVLEFKFTGSVVGISTASGPDAGTVLSSIDGGEWKSTDLFTSWSKNVHLPWYFTLYSGLEDKDHILKLKLSSEKNIMSKGNNCRIRYFFISSRVAEK